MSLCNKFHQISSNIEMAEEMHENQVINRDKISISEISSCSSIMDFDGDNIKCESTLMSMSRIEDNGYAESTISVTYSSINTPRAIGISFQLSRETANRRPLSPVAYGKIKQGKKIEFFDQYSMAYMTISVRHTDLPSQKDIMNEDIQNDAEYTNNVVQFIAKLHDGHGKVKHTRAKKT